MEDLEDFDPSNAKIPFEDCPPKVQAKYLMKLAQRRKAKRLSERDADESAKDVEALNAEREKLSDAREEQKGASPKVPVEDDDLPDDTSPLEDSDEDDDSDSDKPRKRS